MNHKIVKDRQRAHAKSMRREMTGAELKLLNALRARRLMGLEFKRQLPIGNYIVDFACPGHKLIIEVDGSGHGDDNQIRHDTKRTKYIESQGWQVIRIWNEDILKDIDATCSYILAILTQKGVKFA